MSLETQKLRNSGTQRRGFTLVEMLIVVAVLAVLMTIAFRLAGIGTSDDARTKTIVRMQKIENCLSGYYAAFGSYPPVKNHGSPDIYRRVDSAGDQEEGRNSSLVWKQVRAACRVQPFGCEFPPSDADVASLQRWIADVVEHINDSQNYPQYGKDFEGKEHFLQGYAGPKAGDFRGVWDESDWKVVKLFKFGVMSFLLPRYLFMIGGDEMFFGYASADGSSGGGGACAQWSGDNDLPCDPFEGQAFSGWDSVRKYAQLGDNKTGVANDLQRVANIPSQAVCARWMPNLAGTCALPFQGGRTFFGVSIGNYEDREVGFPLLDQTPPSPGVHYPPGGKGKAYKLLSVTIHDGWGQEFYYYSPQPYQSYSLWSSGPNKRTFPPWLPLDKLPSSDRKTAADWMNDDVIQMSH